MKTVIYECNIAMNFPGEDISWRQSVSWLREQFVVSGVTKERYICVSVAYRW